MKLFSKNCACCSKRSPTNAMCRPTLFFPTSHYGKWRALILQARPSSLEFQESAAKSYSISQSHSPRRSQIILQLIPVSSRVVPEGRLFLRHSLMLSKPENRQPLLVSSKMKRIGAFSLSFGVCLNGQWTE